MTNSGHRSNAAVPIRVGIIVPAYNAYSTLSKTFERIPFELLEAMAIKPHIYLIDDGSNDRTLSQMREIAEANKGLVTIIKHIVNRGYGATQKSGLSRSLEDDNKAHVILHSDGQYAPEELPLLLLPVIEGRAQMVIGSKFMKGGVFSQGMPLLRMVGIRLFDALENWVYGLDGLEFHSGYVAYTTDTLRRIDFERLTDRFHFDGEMVLHGGKLNIATLLVPITTCYSAGSSHLDPIPYLADVISIMTSYLFGKYELKLTPTAPNDEQ